MIDVNLLDSLFKEYGYTLQTTRKECRVYLLRQGMYFGAEIVIFDDSEQQELYDEFSRDGFSVKRQHFKSIDEAEEYLFQGFFKTDISKVEIKHRYDEFAEKQMQAYGKDSKIRYEYIQMPFTVFKDTYDDGQEGDNLLNTIFEQIESPGAHLVVVEAAAGYGKTCTSYELFKSFIDRGSTKSIKPIFTELYGNRDVKRFKYVLWSEIDKEKSTTAKQDVVIYNIKKGRIPLIIDGFDELLSKDIDPGSEEGLDEFQQVETMLSTIGGLLNGEAKIILTSRKTAIFAGAQFEQWVDSYEGAFDVVRIQLNKPDINAWLTKDRYDRLINAGIPIAHISNPVLLTYLRNINEEDFNNVVNSPGDITSKYFDFLLNREKARQQLIIPAAEQQNIFQNLAMTFLEYGIMGESRQFVKEMIVDYNKVVLLRYKELSPENILLSELADKLTNHALLDRVGNKDYVSFINEFVFGYLLGKSLLKNTHGFLKIQKPFPDDILEFAVLAFRYSSSDEREALWKQLSQYRSRMSLQHTLVLDGVLLHQIKDSYNSCGVNSLNFEGVEFGKESCKFDNVSFVDCTFDNCSFDPISFEQTFFTGCKFIKCSIKNNGNIPNIGHSVHFYGCEDYHSGFIAGFNINPIIVKEEEQKPLEIQILKKYFKVGGRSTRMKCISYIKTDFPQEQLDVVFTVFNSLKKNKLIIVRGNNSFITQAGINYYHKNA